MPMAEGETKTGEKEKKPRKPKEKKYKADLHILVTDDQYEFVKGLNGGMGFHVRSFIDAQKGKYDKDLEDIKKELDLIEPHYLALKKKKEELEEKKRLDMQVAMAKDKSIEFAHMKLLEALKNSYNQMDLMSGSIWKFYSEQCGQTVDELKVWVREEMAKKGIKV